ncbi:MAG TPA: calcium-binding protein, partial [Dongiaceae bacterium]|nr:calcium-binding protein [Dongiaceae bacterium]
GFLAIEHVLLTGATAINATGNGSNNELTGNSGANKLDGGIGADTLIGGNGADTYTVDNAGDLVVEAAGGIDTVLSSIDYTLTDFVEKLTLTGKDDIDGAGNTLNNTLLGNDGANVLDGLGGNDTMTGGKGDDTYVVDSVMDVVNETIANGSGGGVDTVESSVTFSLATRVNIDNLTLVGGSDINGTGNALANTILGNGGGNILDGGAGADILKGGAGNDTYVLDNAADTVDEEANADTGDAVKSSALIGAAFAGVENYTYTGTKAWAFIGTTDANQISGGSVNDSLNGGQGSDTLLGNGGNDSLTGAEGHDLLDGGTGDDKMSGGSGNDTYVVNAVGDAIVEGGGEGAEDRIMSSVSVNLLSTLAEIEYIVLTGATAINATGNAAANHLTGNDAANKLDGGEGADTMIGGNGADTYTVEDFGDVVEEITAGAAGGIDLVITSIDYTLTANVEKLTLAMGAGDVGGTGNTLSNTLLGNEGANVLDGGAGNDTMTGGKGDDTYIVNVAGDVVNETIAAGGGTDEVQSAVTFNLATRVNIENLTLTADATIHGTGNALNNHIIGSDGANKLDGAAGNDVLEGGLANDTLIGGLGNDLLIGGLGADSLNGGAGVDTFDYNLIEEAGDIISGFVKGIGGDILNLADLLEVDFGIDGSTAFAGGYLDFFFDGTNTQVRVDENGSMDNVTVLTTLLNVSLLETDTANFIVSNV